MLTRERADHPPTPLRLESRAVRYTENGLRHVTASETLTRIPSLVTSGLIARIERLDRTASGYPCYVSFTGSAAASDQLEVHWGKGLSEEQSLVSATMEAVERYAARLHPDQRLVTGSFADLRDRARDPTRFVLPSDTTYAPDLSLDWVWGHSLTRGEAVLVPANLVFCPYVAASPRQQIADYSSNGLAAGNCLEEAILQGLLEVLERDAWMIVEYNRLVMPDLPLHGGLPDTASQVIERLEAAGIRCTLKCLTLDLPVHTFGAGLQGTHDEQPALSFAPGTHLQPEIALIRAITEAIQLYPRAVNFEAWLSSGPVDHLFTPGPALCDLGSCADRSAPDLLDNVTTCVELLRQVGSEVIVVDLSRAEAVFSVVRVLCTGLQPIVNRTNPRFSPRLFEVPVTLGYRRSRMRASEIRLRDLCGVS